MKNHFKKKSFLFAVFLLAIMACSEERRDGNLYDRDLKKSSDTARHYNPPSHVLKGGDSLQPDPANRDTTNQR